MSEYEELKKKFGFLAADDPLLREAFTHRSYAVEHQLGYDNQRLEFLGDAVLEIILTDYLYALYPESPEGDLTKMRSALACEGALAALARELGLGKWLRIGRGEVESHGACRESTLADLFEAVLGAFYIGSGFDQVHAFVLELFRRSYPSPLDLLTRINPKGDLQEFSQKKWGTAPDYRVFHVSGPQHHPCYDVEVRLRHYVAIASGNSRKNAEFEAARSLCRFLKKRGVWA